MVLQSQLLRAAFRDELYKGRLAHHAGNLAAAWEALERAHILSQPILRLHLTAHLAMLRLALQTGDGREVAGQLLRLALAPIGALTGRNPHGNTGRSNVSAFRKMPIPPELHALIDRHRE